MAIYGSNQNNNALVDALLKALSSPAKQQQSPVTDLGRIVVGPRPTESLAGGVVRGTPVSDITPEALPAIPESIPRKEPVLDDNGQTFVGRLLSRLAVPAATAAVGMAIPQTLAGAAGFQSGYTGEIKRQDEAKDALNKQKAEYGLKQELEGKKELKPTFSQDQKIKSIKSGLNRGKVTIGREFGEPSNYDIKTIEDAYAAISDAGLSPELFKEELAKYEDVTVINPKGQVVRIPSYQLEDAIKSGYKTIK